MKLHLSGPVCSIICSSETIMLIWDKSSAPTTRSFILRNFKNTRFGPAGNAAEGNPFERDEVMMDELVAEGTIRREDAALTLETIIALHERYLHQASLLKKEDPRPLEEAFQNVFLFVLEKISVKSSVSR